MIFSHSFLQGLTALFRHKLRASLTTLGMVIGIASVTVSVSVSEGLNLMIMDLLNQMGMGNTIICYRPDWIQREDGTWKRNDSQAYLRHGDAAAIESNAPSVKFVLPEIWWDLRATYGGRSKQARAVGTNRYYAEGHNWKLDRGRFLTNLDVDREEKICVIGADLERDLYPGDSALGKEIAVAGVRLAVVGVMERKPEDSPDFTGSNNALIMPLTTFSQRFAGHDAIGVFFIRASSAFAVSKAEQEVKLVLRRRHQLQAATDAFQFQTSDEIIRGVEQVSFIMKAFLSGVASIALLVGGVGIMNMMLVTVTERTNEIGLRKAVGARRRHILTQFLIESLVLGGVGGCIGVGLGWCLSKLASFGISTALQRSSGDALLVEWPSVVSLESALLAMLIAGCIGVLAGIFPAFRAGLLPPVEAIRHQ